MDHQPGITTSVIDAPIRRKWRLVIAALLVLLLDAGLSFKLFDQLRLAAEQRTVLDATRIQQAVEDHTNRLLETADAFLRMARWHRLHDSDLSSLRSELAEVLTTSTERFYVAALLTDREGRVIFDSGRSETPDVSIEDLPYFRAVKAAHEDLVLLDPTRPGRVRGLELFRLARPIFKDGRFEGAAIFTLSPDFVEDLFRQYAPGPHGEISILTTDHYAVARVPHLAASAIGQPLNDLNLWRQMFDRDHGDYLAVSVLDGVRRHNVFRLLPKYNLVVRVGIADQDSLAAMLENRRLILLAALSLLTALLAGAALLAGLLGRPFDFGRAGTRPDRFLTLFDGAKSAMLLIDPADGAIVEANQAAGEFYGYDPAALKQMRISDINTRLEQSTIQDMTDASSRLRSAFFFRHRLADGRIRDVEVHSGPVEAMGRRLLFSIIHDITDRRRLEDERQRLSMAVEQSPASVIITDPEGKIEYVNAAFTAATGYTAGEVVGQNPRLLKSGETDAGAYAAMWAELAAGNTWRGVFHNRRKDGSLFWEKAMISPLTNEQGRITHYLGIKEDITEQRAMELELHRSTDELQQMTYFVSHDLRQPLRMISSYLTLIRRSLDETISDELGQYFTFVFDGAKRMDRQIQDLLFYSRAAQTPAPNQAVALPAVVAEALQVLEPALRDSGARVTVAADLPTVRGDPGQLMRLFQNLLDNAVKYHAPGVTPELQVGWQDGADEWRLWVADNGIGIAPADRDRVFRIFQRLNRPEDYEGTGIGLAACKRIVESLGGRIWVEPNDGGGSRFLVALPKEAG